MATQYEKLKKSSRTRNTLYGGDEAEGESDRSLAVNGLVGHAALALALRVAALGAGAPCMRT